MAATGLRAWGGAILVVLAAGCEWGSSGGLRFEKVNIGRLPATFRRGTVTTNPAATAYTAVEDLPAGQRVIDNGAPGPLFTKCSPPFFAPKGGLLGYFGLFEQGRDKRIALVMGSAVMQTRLSKTGSLQFGPDGNRWAAIGWEGRLPDEGEEGRVFAGNVAVYIDGPTPRRYADATLPTFSPDGKHVAQLIRNDARQLQLVVDGSPQRTYGEPGDKCSTPVKPAPGDPGLSQQFAARYLADGSLLVLARDESCWSVWKGDTRLASYPTSVVRDPHEVVFDPTFTPLSSILPESLVQAEAAPVAAWWERLEGDTDRWRVVRDGKPVDDEICAKGEDTTPVVLSPDGRRVIHTCAIVEGTELRTFVVVDGTREGPYRFVWGPTFSPDGQHHAYAAARGIDDPWRFYLDGKRQPGGYEHVFPPVLSRDGKHMAFAGMRGDRLTLVLDGRVLGTVDEALRPPRFTESDELVWAVRRVRRVLRLVVHGL